MPMINSDPKNAQGLLWASTGAASAAEVAVGVAVVLRKGAGKGVGLSKAELKRLAADLTIAAEAMNHVQQKAKEGAGQFGGARTRAESPSSSGTSTGSATKS